MEASSQRHSSQTGELHNVELSEALIPKGNKEAAEESRNGGNEQHEEDSSDQRIHVGHPIPEEVLLAIPSATVLWEAQKSLMIGWLVASILAAFALFAFLFSPVVFGPVIGWVGASLYLCTCCQEGLLGLTMDRLTTIKALAVAAGICDITIYILYHVLFAVAVGYGSGLWLDLYTLLFGGVVLIHVSISFAVFCQMNHIEKHLNPISSGLVIDF